jgi:hypothetical protein
MRRSSRVKRRARDHEAGSPGDFQIFEDLTLLDPRSLTESS